MPLVLTPLDVSIASLALLGTGRGLTRPVSVTPVTRTEVLSVTRVRVAGRGIPLDSLVVPHISCSICPDLARVLLAPSCSYPCTILSFCSYPIRLLLLSRPLESRHQGISSHVPSSGYPLPCEASSSAACEAEDAAAREAHMGHIMRRAACLTACRVPHNACVVPHVIASHAVSDMS